MEEAKEKTAITLQMIFPDVNRTIIEDVLRNYKCRKEVEPEIDYEVKQEIEYEKHLEQDKKINGDEESLKVEKECLLQVQNKEDDLEQDMIVEYEYDETLADIGDDCFEKDVDENQNETVLSDNRSSMPKPSFTNYQVDDDSSIDEDWLPPADIRKMKSKRKPQKFLRFKGLIKHNRRYSKNKSFEKEVDENRNEIYSDNPSSRPKQRSTNSLMQEASWKEGWVPPIKKRKSNHSIRCSKNKSFEKEVNENLNKVFSDNPSSRPLIDLCLQRLTNSQVQEAGWVPPIKKRKSNLERTYFQCTTCPLKFLTLRGLQKHRLIKHHNKLTIACYICTKTIEYGLIREHIRTAHSGTKLYCCQTCGACFRSENHFTLHKCAPQDAPSERGIPMYQCQICDKAYKIPYLLNIHQRIYRHAGKMEVNPIPSENFQCTECDQTFTSNMLLRLHSVTHKNKKFLCRVCGKVSETRTLAANHLKVHDNVLPYSCSVCGEKFSSLENLNFHIFHKLDRSVGITQEAFTNSRILKNHNIIINSGNTTDYTCKICSKGFTEDIHLKCHMLRVHTANKPYSCDICGKIFFAKKYVTVHKEKFHKET